MRPIGKKGLELIKKWEGCRLNAYQDTAGIWTIGYGHTEGVYKGMVISQQQAEDYLTADCQIYANCVDSALYCPFTKQLNDNQRDALISFTYNCGAGSLTRLCKNRTVQDVPKHILAYCNDVAGHKLQGLLNRRKEELDLFNSPVEKENDVIKEQNDVIKYYETIEEIPENYKNEIKGYIYRGSLSGTDKGLHLSEDMIRVLCIVSRDKK